MSFSDFLSGDPAFTAFQQRARKKLERLYLELRRPPSSAKDEQEPEPPKESVVVPALAIIRALNEYALVMFFSFLLPSFSRCLDIVEEYLAQQVSGDTTVRALMQIFDALGETAGTRRLKSTNSSRLVIGIGLFSTSFHLCTVTYSLCQRLRTGPPRRFLPGSRSSISANTNKPSKRNKLQGVC
jgi:hypothetical protein